MYDDALKERLYVYKKVLAVRLFDSSCRVDGHVGGRYCRRKEDIKFFYYHLCWKENKKVLIRDDDERDGAWAGQSYSLQQR